MYYLAMYVVGKMAPGIVNPEDDVPFMNHEKTITTETIKTCRHLDRRNAVDTSSHPASTATRKTTSLASNPILLKLEPVAKRS